MEEGRRGGGGRAGSPCTGRGCLACVIDSAGSVDLSRVRRTAAAPRNRSVLLACSRSPRPGHAGRVAGDRPTAAAGILRSARKSHRRYPRRMWRIEIRLQTQDEAARQRVSADVAAWQQLSNVSLSVVEERVGTGRLRGEAGSSASATVIKSRLASGTRRKPRRPGRLPWTSYPAPCPSRSSP
jgi:hypothetical protein